MIGRVIVAALSAATALAIYFPAGLVRLSSAIGVRWRRSRDGAGAEGLRALGRLSAPRSLPGSAAPTPPGPGRQEHHGPPTAR